MITSREPENNGKSLVMFSHAFIVHQILLDISDIGEALDHSINEETPLPGLRSEWDLVQ